MNGRKKENELFERKNERDLIIWKEEWKRMNEGIECNNISRKSI